MAWAPRIDTVVGPLRLTLRADDEQLPPDEGSRALPSGEFECRWTLPGGGSARLIAVALPITEGGYDEGEWVVPLGVVGLILTVQGDIGCEVLGFTALCDQVRVVDAWRTDSSVGRHFDKGLSVDMFLVGNSRFAVGEDAIGPQPSIEEGYSSFTTAGLRWKLPREATLETCPSIHAVVAWSDREPADDYAFFATDATVEEIQAHSPFG